MALTSFPVIRTMPLDSVFSAISQETSPAVAAERPMTVSHAGASTPRRPSLVAAAAVIVAVESAVSFASRSRSKSGSAAFGAG